LFNPLAKTHFPVAPLSVQPQLALNSPLVQAAFALVLVQKPPEYKVHVILSLAVQLP
jgi:hypothetical protein